MTSSPRASLLAPFWIAVCALPAAGGCQCRESKPATAAVEEQRNRDLAALPQAVGGLMEQLAAEASAREKDADTLSLEAVVAKSGVAFEAPQQMLGRTVLARYCASARSNDGLTVTVCEYPSVDQAARGAAEVTAVRGKVSGWQAKQRKKSVLEVVARSDAKPESVASVLAAFDAL
ncbi:MAG: hypothetical protein IAE78_20240 [Myxococcus sp.]|nr:hypothetical protein [Myxococcus sp.]